MACRTTYCVGGGCEPTSTDVKGWCTAFGFVYNADDPLAQDYKNVIAQAPADVHNAVWEAMAEACMRCRSVFYCNSTPGDAGGTRSGQSSTNFLGSVGSTAIGASKIIAGALGASSAVLAPVTFGLSAIFAGVMAVFAHHAQAVANQANTLTQLCPYISEAIYKADQAVLNGQATGEEAVAFLSQIMTQAKQSTASLTHSCNAFCGYDAIFDCIVQISTPYYAIIEAQSVAAPMSDPTFVPPGVGPVPIVRPQTPALPVTSTVEPIEPAPAQPKLSQTSFILIAAAVMAVILLSTRTQTVVVSG